MTACLGPKSAVGIEPCKGHILGILGPYLEAHGCWGLTVESSKLEHGCGRAIIWTYGNIMCFGVMVT